jgi:Pirin
MEGAGVRICRTIGTGALRNLDPFLMLASAFIALLGRHSVTVLHWWKTAHLAKLWYLINFASFVAATAHIWLQSSPVDWISRKARICLCPLQDELKLPTSEATSGFPDHPHRGFETCSIMLKGKMEHRDHIGNHVRALQICAAAGPWAICISTPRLPGVFVAAGVMSRLVELIPDCLLQGVIGPGGVQWMTAGRGIVHSEVRNTVVLVFYAHMAVLIWHFAWLVGHMLLSQVRSWKLVTCADAHDDRRWWLAWIPALDQLAQGAQNGEAKVGAHLYCFWGMFIMVCSFNCTYILLLFAASARLAILWTVIWFEAGGWCCPVPQLYRYQDYQASDIPIVEKDGVKVRIMAGSSYGAEGPIKVRTYLRVMMLGSFHKSTIARCEAVFMCLTIQCSWFARQGAAQRGCWYCAACACRCATQECCWTSMCRRAPRFPPRYGF